MRRRALAMQLCYKAFWHIAEGDRESKGVIQKMHTTSAVKKIKMNLQKIIIVVSMKIIVTATIKTTLTIATTYNKNNSSSDKSNNRGQLQQFL